MRGKFSTYIMGNMKDKSIEKYMDGDGNLHDVTDAMKKTLEDLGKDNLYVVGIHKDTMNLCGDIVSMTAFIYTDSYDVFPGGEEVVPVLHHALQDNGEHTLHRDLFVQQLADGFRLFPAGLVHRQVLHEVHDLVVWQLVHHGLHQAPVVAGHLRELLVPLHVG